MLHYLHKNLVRVNWNGLHYTIYLTRWWCSVLTFRSAPICNLPTSQLYCFHINNSFMFPRMSPFHHPVALLMEYLFQFIKYHFSALPWPETFYFTFEWSNSASRERRDNWIRHQMGWDLILSTWMKPPFTAVKEMYLGSLSLLSIWNF